MVISLIFFNLGFLHFFRNVSNDSDSVAYQHRVLTVSEYGFAVAVPEYGLRDRLMVHVNVEDCNIEVYSFNFIIFILDSFLK